MTGTTTSLSDMDFSSLNEAQKRATTFTGKHLLVLAGAGTGKTRVIIARALWLMEQGVDPTTIRILSFTKKSAGEIVDRIKAEAVDIPAAKDLHGSTFHSWCMELIGRYPDEFGMKDFVGIDADERQSILYEIAKVYDSPVKELPRELSISPYYVSDILSFKTNTLCSLEEAVLEKLDPRVLQFLGEDGVAVLCDLCDQAEQDYTAYKKERRYVDYDDMLSVVADVLSANSDLCGKLCSEYTNILIDEMQDTNPLQWKLLESVFDSCHLFCVGDDAQSIYAFRGADFRSIHSFTERVPGGEVCKLTDNYRSTQKILDLSNWLLRQSPLEYDKDLHAIRGKGEKPELYFCHGRPKEAELLLAIIQRGLKAGKKCSDYMVLSRTSRRVEELARALTQAGIPIIQLGGKKNSVEKPYVKDVIVALKIIINYRDELSWHHFLKLWSFEGWFDAPAFVECAMASNSLDEALANLPRADKLSEKISSCLTMARECWNEPAAAFSIIVSNMTPILARRYEDWDTCKEDLDTLRLMAVTCDNIQSFVGEYVADPDAALIRHNIEDDKPDCITISTVHSAKGLECDTAIVLAREFPSFWTRTDDDFEEERRTLYVALTRAKNSLILTTYDHITFSMMEQLRKDPMLSKTRLLLDEEPFFRDIPDNLLTTFPKPGIQRPFTAAVDVNADIHLPNLPEQ